jgi:hypothetical protein
LFPFVQPAFRGAAKAVSLLVLSATALAIAGCENHRANARASASPGGTTTANTSPEQRDACRQTGGQFPDTSIHIGDTADSSWRRSFARGAEYRCVIHPALPAVRVLIAGDSTATALESLVILSDSAAAFPAQRLVIDGDIPAPSRTDVVRMLDLDADGYNDLLVGNSWGATGNTTYDIWRYNPLAHQFMKDGELSDTFNPSPVAGSACVHTHSNSSVADGEAARLCLRGGHWLTDSSETTTWDREAHVIVRERRARRKDSLVVVERTVRPDSVA